MRFPEEAALARIPDRKVSEARTAERRSTPNAQFPTPKADSRSWELVVGWLGVEHHVSEFDADPFCVWNGLNTSRGVPNRGSPAAVCPIVEAHPTPC
jgi:hypothetical protein